MLWPSSKRLRDAHDDARTTWENRFAEQLCFPHPSATPSPKTCDTTATCHTPHHAAEPVRPPEPVTPPEPTSYTGPKPIAFDGDNLWFSARTVFELEAKPRRSPSWGLKMLLTPFGLNIEAKNGMCRFGPGRRQRLVQASRNLGRGDLEALSIPDKPDPTVEDSNEEDAPKPSTPSEPEVPDE